MDKSLRVMHDKLLAQKPDGAEHDETTCPICSSDETEEHMSDKTFTEDEVAAKVAEATASLEDRIAELEATLEDSEVAEKIKEATAPLNEKIAELEADLDKATLRAEEAEKTVEETEKYWKDLETQEAVKAEREARKADRVEKVKEVASFSDDYIEQRADAWAELSDEDFAAVLEDWKAIATKSPKEGKKEEEIPETFLTATGKKSDNDAITALRTLRRKGVDPRQIR